MTDEKGLAVPAPSKVQTGEQVPRSVAKIMVDPQDDVQEYMATMISDAIVAQDSVDMLFTRGRNKEEAFAQGSIQAYHKLAGIANEIMAEHATDEGVNDLLRMAVRSNFQQFVNSAHKQQEVMVNVNGEIGIKAEGLPSARDRYERTRVERERERREREQQQQQQLLLQQQLAARQPRLREARGMADWGKKKYVED
jgi:hypothetical protein